LNKKVAAPGLENRD